VNEKLPEQPGTEVVIMGSAQAALFDDPTRLLNLSDGELAKLTLALHDHLGGIMPTLRRQVGLVAWAEWHRRTDGKYHAWLDDTAKLLGVDTQTIIRWRRSVVRAEGLVVPTAAQQRAIEQKPAGQRRSGIKVTPAIATTAEAAPAPSATVEPAAETATEPGSATERSSSPSRTPEPEYPSVTWDGRLVPTARGQAGRLMEAIRSFDPSLVGPTMTPDEIREVRDFASALVSSRSVTARSVPAQREKRRHAPEPEGKCPHPVSRRLGDGCGQCGEKVKR